MRYRHRAGQWGKRRRAFNEWARFSPTDPRRCKEGWEMCWQYARENL